MSKILNLIIAVGFSALMSTATEASERTPSEYGVLSKDVFKQVMFHMDDKSLMTLGTCNHSLVKYSDWTFSLRSKHTFGLEMPFECNTAFRPWAYTYFTLNLMRSDLTEFLMTDEEITNTRLLHRNPILSLFDSLCSALRIKSSQNYRAPELSVDKYVKLCKKLGNSHLPDVFLRVLEKSNLPIDQKWSYFNADLEGKINEINADTPSDLLRIITYGVDSVCYLKTELKTVLANKLLQAGKWDLSANQWKNVISESKEDAPWQARQGLGTCLFKQGLYSEAASELQAAIENGDERWQTRLLLGDCLHRQGLYSESAAEFQAAIEKENGDAPWQARQGLGTCLFKQGLYSEAAPELQAAIENGDERWQTRVLLGDCLQRQGLCSEAAAEFQAAIEKENSDERWQTRLALGDCLQRQGLHSEAAAEFQTAIEKANGTEPWQTRASLGSSLKQLDLYKEALVEFQAALAKFNGDEGMSKRLNSEIQSCLEKINK